MTEQFVFESPSLVILSTLESNVVILNHFSFSHCPALLGMLNMKNKVSVCNHLWDMQETVASYFLSSTPKPDTEKKNLCVCIHTPSEPIGSKTVRILAHVQM